MDSRREFIKKAAVLSAGTGLLGSLPPSIQKAFAIDPKLGSTYLDAEHVVILMQENRSFDHCFGSLQGVRGYNDPRAVVQPDNNLVWLQKNKAGETYLPFRLNMKETKSTWLGNLPHSWPNQVDARNEGRYDKWLDSKRSGRKMYGDMPLTLGYYTREDLPFYYAMADAFTVCDQNFCSSLTGTTPNRLYLWTGTIKAEPNADAFACVMNEDADYDTEVHWKTFPERLEENNIPWKIYQNELSVGVGFEGEEDSWLANFGDNPLEYFSQYKVRFSEAHIKSIPKTMADLEVQIKQLQAKLPNFAADSKEILQAGKQLKNLQANLESAKKEQIIYTKENYEKLTQLEKNLHEKAFSTNKNHPAYHDLETLKYKDGTTEREVEIPKGDIFHEFREDVNTGKLPTVSWIVAPENFSDHPAAPWYGSWYISEVMDILTKKPEVWQKTIFILCYDENDGYYDHVPPFVAPNPNKPETGLVSKGIDASLEYVTLEQDKNRRAKNIIRESSIGLGYRVPLVIASPWSRGGAVNSQVFDHTSILQFLENFLSHKFNKEIKETNITQWRRTVCGDLTSVFKPHNGEKIIKPTPVAKNEFIEEIYNAKFKKDPFGFKQLTKEEIAQINIDPASFPLMPRQEKGTRVSSALPYELYVNGKLNAEKKTFEIEFKAANNVFGNNSAGSPFNVHAKVGDDVKVRSYAVVAGDTLNDNWDISTFNDGNYDLSIYGPNGFFRQFKGNINDPEIDIEFKYESNKVNKKKLTGNIEFAFINLNTTHNYSIEIKDNAYKNNDRKNVLKNTAKTSLVLDLSKSHNWYDFSIKISGNNIFEKRYAGRVETGKVGFSDPVMGAV